MTIPAFIATEIVAGAVANRVASFDNGRLLFEAVYRPVHVTLLIAVFSFMMRYLDGSERPVADQGIGWKAHSLRNIFVGVLAGGALVAMAVIIIAVAGSYRAALLPDANPGRIILVLWVLASAALLEEVMFRGYPFQRLVESLGVIPATAIFGLSFGAIHMGNPHASKLGALNTALVGILFALAYLRTKTLWLPFGFHFAWNTTMGLLFGLPVSGLTMFSVAVKGMANGPVWLTGGDYGVEAGMTGTAVILLGITLMSLFPARNFNPSVA